MKSSRLKSLDILRGWCMIAILFFHTQMYFFGGDVIPYTLYVPNALAIFFFISGFLACGKERSATESARIILTRLIIPYIFFTFVIGIVKLQVSDGSIDWVKLFSNMVSGRASWFVAALIIVEIVFTAVHKLLSGNSYVVLFMGVAGAVAAYFVQREPDNMANFIGIIPFALPPALLGGFYYCMGFLFHRHVLPTVPMRRSVGFRLRSGDDNVPRANRAMTVTLCWLIPLLVLFVLVKWYEDVKGYHFLFASLWADPYLLFVVDLLLGSVGLTTLLLLLWPNAHRRQRHLSFKSRKPEMYMFVTPAWIGMHCMVFYYFAGAVPLVTTYAVKTFFTAPRLPDTWYASSGFWLSFVVVVGVASAIAWVVYNWLPFLIGLRRSNKQK